MSKQYIDTGFRQKGKIILAHKDCKKCYGRGYWGRNKIKDNLIGCKCIIKSELPISWIKI